MTVAGAQLRRSRVWLGLTLALAILGARAATASAETLVTSNITSHTTWTSSGSPYIIERSGGVSVEPGVTLTIQPGVTVEFNKEKGPHLSVEGRVNAIGNAANPITFTSTQGAKGTGAPGQWEGIKIWSGRSNFSWAHFYYGAHGSGGYYAYGVLTLQGGTAAIAHSTFEHNEYSGVVVSGGTANVSYSTFEHDGDGLAGGDVMHVSYSTIANNTENGVFLNGTKTGSTFNYDKITANGSLGIRIQQYCTEPIASFAHGEHNSIYNNGPHSGQEDGGDLYTLYTCKALPIDWNHNYWGAAFIDKGELLEKPGCWYIVSVPGSVQPEGYLAYSNWNNPKDGTTRPGPIKTGRGAATYFKTEGCIIESAEIPVWNSFYVGPGNVEGEVQPKPIPAPEGSDLYGNASTGYDGGLEATPNLAKAKCKDPVDCITGNLSESFTDLAIAGLNGGLTFTRAYNSQAASSASSAGPLGWGWSFTFGDTLTIDPSTKNATVVGAQGNTVRLTYGAGKYSAPPWVQATLAKNEDGSYTYTLPDQRKERFSSEGQLQWSEDRNGNRTTDSYTSGKLTSVTDASARSLSIAYNAGGRIEKITDPASHKVEYGYDGSGNLTSVKDARGHTTSFAYDASHQLTSVTDPRNGKVTNKYDASHRVTEQVDPLEHKSTWAYSEGDTQITDAAGHVTDEQYTSNLPTQVVQAFGTASASITTYGYDERDNLASVTDPNIDTVTYEYDTSGNRTSEADQLGDETTWTYNSTHDVLSVKTPKGETTTIKRDSHGNPESVSRPAPESKTQTTKYKYDAHGNLESVTDPLERTWKYGYDAQGDRTSQTDPLGDKRTWTFDQDSYETSSVSPRGNVEGAEAAKFTTKTERDAEGRPLKLTDPLGHETKYAYDANGNLESLTDANGHTTKYTYDADNERTKVDAPNGAITETGYDVTRRVTSQTDGNKHTTKYERNALGRVAEVIDPLKRTTTKRYDEAGNLTSITDAASRTTTLTYDEANRLGEVSYSDGKTSAVKYEYDKDGNRTKMVDGTGTTSYKYDQLDRLTESKDGHGDKVAYEYDLANQQTKLTYPNGKAVTRAFDNAGRLKSVTDWLEHTTTFSYDADSDQTAAVFPTTVPSEDTYAYNEADQLTGIEMKSGPVPVATLAYGRDHVGQVSSTTSKGLPGELETAYAYDENERLTKAGATAYEYDSADNATKVGSSTNTYDSADELEKGTGVSYSFDELGARTKRTPTSGPATSYGYDQAGNLTSVTRPKEGETPAIEDTYGYDGNSLRVSQTVSGSTSYFSWDASGGLPLLLSDGQSSYVYGAGGLPVEQINSEGKVLYLHHDQQGSTRLLTGTVGVIEGAATYDAYGNLTGTTGTATSPLGYDGQYTNSDTGLIYLRARAYDAATAQFMSVDPMAAVTGAPYGYAAESPLNLADPSGLDLGDRLKSLGGNVLNGLAGAADTVTGGHSTEALEELGVHPDTCSVAFQVGKIGVNFVPALAVLRGARLAEEGIYIIRGAEETYVGQSGNIAARLAQHVASDRFTQAEVDAAERIAVPGGRTAREIAEQLKIDELGGIKVLGNQRNAIGPRRFGLMPEGYTRP